MHLQKNNALRARLGVESLEDRTVPTYFGASGGESIAVGAVMSQPGPGPNDVITGTGPGVPGLVRITNTNLQLLQSFYPFGTGFKGGVYVAAADVTGDGTVDVICATGKGTTGTVKVYEFINGGMQLISSFTPFGVNYTGGIDVAAGNVSGDVITAGATGVANQIVVAQASGGDTVRVFGYDDNSGTPQYDMLNSFQAYGAKYTGGVTLTVADIDTQLPPPNSHNYSSIITGMATSLPEVAIWSAQTATVTLRAEYMAFNTQFAVFRNGINVVAGDTDAQRGAEIYVNLRGTGLIGIFAGQTSAMLGSISTYPPEYGSMVNMAIGGITAYAPTGDDEVVGTYYVRDLVVVAADTGPYSPLLSSVQQIPVDLPGAAGKPAGLNGSRAL